MKRSRWRGAPPPYHQRTDVAQLRRAIPTIGPVGVSERIGTLDILRGVAILGMLLVNMTADLPWPIEPWNDGANEAAAQLVSIFASNKFINLFTLLFGLGVALQMRRAARRGTPFALRYSRRLLVLLLIGGATFLFTWQGWILIVFAYLGFVLLLLRNRAPRTILLVALVLWLFGNGRELVHNFSEQSTALSPTVEETEPQAARERVRDEQRVQAGAKRSYGERITGRAGGLLGSLSSLEFYLEELIGEQLPILLLGFYVGRRRILEDVGLHRRFI